jgi:hypothetical protein
VSDDLDGIDPSVLVDVLAFVLRRAASDFVIAHHIATALGTPTEWFVNVAVMTADFAHELDPTHKETP